jgi:signal transduction histidine kinase
MFVSVNNSIDEALVMLKHKYKYRVEIKKELGEIPEITALPGKLNQVFVNVLSNAFDAIVDKGVVNISTRYRSEMSLIEIVVEDNGKGIEKEDVDKIFDPFFTTKDPGSGIGLGMYISYGIISQLGGTIKIDSERGRGTTIEITLPVSDKS